MRQLARFGVVNALVMEFEQVFAQRARQAFVPGQAIDHLRRRIEIGAIKSPGILAGLLGLVHGGVGAGDQLVLIRSVQGVQGDAEAGRYVQRLAFKAKRYLRDGAHHALGQGFRLLYVGIGQQQGEFVTAKAEQHFVAPGQPGNLARDAHQHRIACGMAEVIVDGLEFVEIEVKQRGCDVRDTGLAARFDQCAFQFVLEAVSVVQAGQRVALGQVEQLLGGLALAGDILVNPQMAYEATFPVAHSVAQLSDDAAIPHDDFMSVRVALKAQYIRDEVEIFRWLRQFAGAARKYRVGAETDQVGVGRQQPDVVEGGVVVDDAAVVTDEQDAQIHGRQQRLQTGALGFRAGQVFQRFGFRCLQFGNVADAGADSKELAFAVVDGMPVHRCPETRAILALHAELIALAGAAAQGMLKVLRRFETVAFRDQTERKAGQCKTFVRVVAGHPRYRGIDPDGASARLDPEFQVVGVIGDGKEALFAVLQFG